MRKRSIIGTAGVLAVGAAALVYSGLNKLVGKEIILTMNVGKTDGQLNVDIDFDVNETEQGVGVVEEAAEITAEEIESKVEDLTKYEAAAEAEEEELVR